MAIAAAAAAATRAATKPVSTACFVAVCTDELTIPAAAAAATTGRSPSFAAADQSRLCSADGKPSRSDELCRIESTRGGASDGVDAVEQLSPQLWPAATGAASTNTGSYGCKSTNGRSLATSDESTSPILLVDNTGCCAAATTAAASIPTTGPGAAAPREQRTVDLVDVAGSFIGWADCFTQTGGRCTAVASAAEKLRQQYRK